MANQQLGFDKLDTLLQARDIAQLSYKEIVNLFIQEDGLENYLPDQLSQSDPRNEEKVLFNSARSVRPHDNVPPLASGQGSRPIKQECIICAGNTTGIIDVEQLSEGFTFINKNLFPVVYPYQQVESKLESIEEPGSHDVDGNMVHGLHFLQWTSSIHERDWHNMPVADLVVVMNRLAALEKTLLTTSQDVMPGLEAYGDERGRYGFVSFIKNSGSPVGGSIEHGHQQIVFSNIMPRRVRENLAFKRRTGEVFSQYILRENPPELVVREFPHAVLLIPHYMRRPFDMLLLLKDTGKSYLHELSRQQLVSIAEGWQVGIQLLRAVLATRRRNIAYNVLTHNGPGAGLYFEFLPYTQEEGGFEKLGLSVCQSNPQQANQTFKGILDTL